MVFTKPDQIPPIMKTTHIILLTAFAATLAALSPAAGQQEGISAPEGGPLATLPRGQYRCSLPGDAGGAAYTPVASEDFRIIAASRYSNAKGEGTYLLRGRDLTFTRGPMKGARYERISGSQLRKIGPDGQPGELLCTRMG